MSNEEKICTKCELKKPIKEFRKAKRGKYGRRSHCKECELEYGEEYRKTMDKERKSIYNKNYSEANKELNNEKRINSGYSKNYYKNNKEKIKNSSKLYRETHAEYMADYLKNYYKENKEELKDYAKTHRLNRTEEKIFNDRVYYRNYVKLRCNIDSLFKLTRDIRNMIYKALANKGYRKNAKTEIILGCSFEEFRQHLESKFLPWMNWHNHGKYNGAESHGWDIDHRVPLSTAKSFEDVIKLNHHTNLQPLCSYINRVVKRDKI